MTAPLTYPEAAKELGVTETWLRRHIKRLPHKKKGRVVTFSPADIERIEQLHHVEPGPPAAPQAPAGSHPLAELKPLPSRGSRQRVS